MKKWIWALVLLIIVLVVVAWWLPATVQVQQTLVLKRPLSAVERSMINTKHWPEWWPGKQVADSVYEHAGHRWQINTILLNGFTATDLDQPGRYYDCKIVLMENNQTALSLTVWQQAGANPISKLRANFSKAAYQRFAESWLASVASYFESDERLYGFKVVQTKVKDSSYLSVRQQYDHAPTVADVYSLVDELRTYISTNKGQAVNAPIMNVYRESATRYELMVAIATAFDLPGTNRYQLKKMMLGNILEGEVKGGAATAAKAEASMRLYANDYRKISPAIPFQQLVTDRRTEPDTSKWVTKLCYPIFN
jgi:hypothetical protein